MESIQFILVTQMCFANYNECFKKNENTECIFRLRPPEHGVYRSADGTKSMVAVKSKKTKLVMFTKGTVGRNKLRVRERAREKEH